MYSQCKIIFMNCALIICLLSVSCVSEFTDKTSFSAQKDSLPKPTPKPDPNPQPEPDLQDVEILNINLSDSAHQKCLDSSEILSNKIVAISNNGTVFGNMMVSNNGTCIRSGFKTLNQTIIPLLISNPDNQTDKFDGLLQAVSDNLVVVSGNFSSKKSLIANEIVTEIDNLSNFRVFYDQNSPVIFVAISSDDRYIMYHTLTTTKNLLDVEQNTLITPDFLRTPAAIGTNGQILLATMHSDLCDINTQECDSLDAYFKNEIKGYLAYMSPTGEYFYGNSSSDAKDNNNKTIFSFAKQTHKVTRVGKELGIIDTDVTDDGNVIMQKNSGDNTKYLYIAKTNKFYSIKDIVKALKIADFTSLKISRDDHYIIFYNEYSKSDTRLSFVVVHLKSGVNQFVSTNLQDVKVVNIIPNNVRQCLQNNSIALPIKDAVVAVGDDGTIYGNILQAEEDEQDNTNCNSVPYKFSDNDEQIKTLSYPDNKIAFSATTNSISNNGIILSELLGIIDLKHLMYGDRVFYHDVTGSLSDAKMINVRLGMTAYEQLLVSAQGSYAAYNNNIYDIKNNKNIYDIKFSGITGLTETAIVGYKQSADQSKYGVFCNYNNSCKNFDQDHNIFTQNEIDVISADNQFIYGVGNKDSNSQIFRYHQDKNTVSIIAENYDIDKRYPVLKDGSLFLTNSNKEQFLYVVKYNKIFPVRNLNQKLGVNNVQSNFVISPNGREMVFFQSYNTKYRDLNFTKIHLDDDFSELIANGQLSN
jgi:hypothetical protein